MLLSKPLYQLHEQTVRTIYSDLKQRADAAGDLLPGTPGTLVKRTTAVEQESATLEESYRDAPQALRDATLSRMPRILALLRQHPQTQETFSALMPQRRF